jgi:hypothetical protein
MPYFLLRSLLIIVIMFNSMMTAQAAVSHLGVTPPAGQDERAENVANVANVKGAENCHDMGSMSTNMADMSHSADAMMGAYYTDEERDANSPFLAHKTACCQNDLCHCAFALQIPLVNLAVLTFPNRQPVQSLRAATLYTSAEPSRTLRPPIV